MGIRAAGNIEIQGPGSLEVNVGGETMDGISVAGNVSLRETNLVVNAPGGIGIASDGTVSLDNAQVTLPRCMRASTPSISLSKTAA